MEFFGSMTSHVEGLLCFSVSDGNKEWTYFNSEGKPIYVMARAFPIEAEDEKGKECVIVNTDITDLKLKLKRIELYALETKEKLKKLSDEHNLLKRNIATFIRKKNAD